mmetsp:Transcript_121517/g.389100  ORF Transcript_121517/g.389100 Transcript_121517/m.389100 type:complete len:219 (+) Transcript_121517:246-902(+)
MTRTCIGAARKFSICQSRALPTDEGALSQDGRREPLRLGRPRVPCGVARALVGLPRRLPSPRGLVPISVAWQHSRAPNLPLALFGQSCRRVRHLPSTRIASLHADSEADALAEGDALALSLMHNDVPAVEGTSLCAIDEGSPTSVVVVTLEHTNEQCLLSQIQRHGAFLVAQTTSRHQFIDLALQHLTRPAGEHRHLSQCHCRRRGWGHRGGRGSKVT